MIPTYRLTGDTFEIRDLGMVYVAQLTCACNRDDLTQLIGTEFEVDGQKKKIRAIESYAVHYQGFKPIGLLVENSESLKKDQ